MKGNIFVKVKDSVITFSKYFVSIWKDQNRKNAFYKSKIIGNLSLYYRILSFVVFHLLERTSGVKRNNGCWYQTHWRDWERFCK